MKIEAIRALDDGDLQVRMDKARKDLFDLRVQAARGSVDSPSDIGAVRKSIARMMTVLRERELGKSRNAR